MTGDVGYWVVMRRLTRRELSEGAAFCLELGTGLLENGAETSRVEETLRFVGIGMGIEVESVVTPTGISLTFGSGEVITRLVRIKTRSVNLDKVARLNELSRRMHDSSFTFSDLRAQVSQIRQAPPLYSETQQILATAVAAGSLTFLLGGLWGEALVAVLAALFGHYWLHKEGNEFPTFLSRFFLGFSSTVFAILASHFWQLNTEPIVVGSLLFHMPGLGFVSAVRDLMSDELIAGVARAAEAMVVTLGMASGVLACLGFSLRLGVFV